MDSPCILETNDCFQNTLKKKKGIKLMSYLPPPKKNRVCVKGDSEKMAVRKEVWYHA